MRRELLLALAAGMAAGVLIAWGVSTVRPQRNEVEVLHGYTSAVNWSGEAIGFVKTPDAESGEGFEIAGAMWRDETRPGWGHGRSQDGHPTCVEPLTRGQEIRLGIVRTAPGEAPGTSVVVWLECLGEPAGRID